MSSEREDRARTKRLRGSWKSGQEPDEELDDDSFYALRPEHHSKPHRDHERRDRRVDKRREVRREKRDND